jgi:hypothetical protein
VGEKDLKVTDKRMFTADGELREEYRHLDRRAENDAAAAASEASEASAAESPPEPAARQEPGGAAAQGPAPWARPEPAPSPPAPEAQEAAEPQEAPEPRDSEPGAPGPPGAEPQEAEPAAEAASPVAGEPAEDFPRIEIPGTPEGFGAPTFLDLVSLLAEPIALYLGDAQLPDGKSAENLDMARLHIDLLDVLRQKTAGNLELAESRLLEDLLYRCRLRYVQKRG